MNRLAINQEGISIGTISGGIVNFGGAGCIAPITVTTNSGSSSENTDAEITMSSSLSSTAQKNIKDILELIRKMNKNKVKRRYGS